MLESKLQHINWRFNQLTVANNTSVETLVIQVHILDDMSVGISSSSTLKGKENNLRKGKISLEMAKGDKIRTLQQLIDLLPIMISPRQFARMTGPIGS